MTTAITKQDNGNVSICGDLNAVTVPKLLETGLAVLEELDDITIDLDHVERSDSSGLAMLTELLRSATKANKKIRFINMPPQLLAIAKISGLDEILPIK